MAVMVDVLGTVAVHGAGGAVSGRALGGRRARVVLVALADAVTGLRSALGREAGAVAPPELPVAVSRALARLAGTTALLAGTTPGGHE